MATHMRRNEKRLLRTYELVGQPVIVAPARARLGRIADIVIDDRTHRVIGFFLRVRPLGRTRILPFAEVQSFEDRAVVVESNAALLSTSAWAEPAHVARVSRLRGKQLVTSAGDNVGTISDAFVDPGSGDVRALEISVPEARTDRRRFMFVRTSPVMQLGADSIVVADRARAETRDLTRVGASP